MPSKPTFDVKTFLAKIGTGRKILAVRKKHKIYTQGAPSDALFYIQKGKVKLTVISNAGKEATIAITLKIPLNEAMASFRRLIGIRL